MPNYSASAIAHPNIAFIKYWGNLDDRLRLPLNSSISMNLACLETRTTVTFDPAFRADTFSLNGRFETDPSLRCVSNFLDLLRGLASKHMFAQVVSTNNFLAGAGIASSAAGFAALALAGSRALGLKLNERQLSVLARCGSGSAARSIPGGFVEWHAAAKDEDSFAESIAPPDHWELVDCIAILDKSPKQVSSTEGHSLAPTSPLQAARIADAPRRLKICREAILKRNFEPFAEIVELDSNLMHAVMMTSQPPLFYWEPISIRIMKQVSLWRKENIEVCYTVDAGPNVHVICMSKDAALVSSRLAAIDGITMVQTSGVGGPAGIVEE